MLWRLAKRWESDGQLLDHALYPPPGRLVRTAGGKYHLRELGTQGPPVVLEAGIGATSISWALVDERLAEFARVYEYDRAGYGWSAPNDRPKVARDLVEQLREVLAAAGAPSPRILVGHSFGGMMMRLYAGLYPEEVAGVVMVDALAPEEWFPLDFRRTVMLRRGVALSRRGEWLAQRGVVRFALGKLERGQGRMPKLLSMLGGVGGIGVQNRIAHQIRKLPQSQWGPVRAHWSRPSSFATLAEHLADLPASCAQAQIVDHLGDTPLIVLAADTQTPPGHQGRQARLAKLSRQGDYRQIHGTTHWLMLDAPDAVVDAVRELAKNV
jgi:pimeloyl-ACP methyl ester carboxylesterase